MIIDSEFRIKLLEHINLCFKKKLATLFEERDLVKIYYQSQKDSEGNVSERTQRKADEIFRSCDIAEKTVAILQRKQNFI